MVTAINYLNQITGIIRQAETEYKINSRELSLLDLETQDLLHCVEREETFNPLRACYLIKKLKNIRNKRRVVKNSQELLQMLVSNINNENFKKISKKLQNKLRQQSEFVYQPKILKLTEPEGSIIHN